MHGVRGRPIPYDPDASERGNVASVRLDLDDEEAGSNMGRGRSGMANGNVGAATGPGRVRSAFKSGTPARVHHNPFDDVLEQIDRAARVLHPDPDALEPLRHPRRQVIVSVPVIMDDGHLRIFDGY